MNKSYVLVYNNEKNPMDEIINRSAFVELEAALKIFEGNFFHNIAVMPADLFEEEQLMGRQESIPPGRESNSYLSSFIITFPGIVYI